jgi:Family of unknown function (DUF6173)
MSENLFNALSLPSFSANVAPRSSVNPAAWAYERLGKYIKNFEAELDDDHEIGARLVSFGQSVIFHVEDIGYHGPDIITFFGRNDAMEKVQLIQHVSQLSFLLVAVKKQQEKPRRIGFLWDKEETKSDS